MILLALIVLFLLGLLLAAGCIAGLCAIWILPEEKRPYDSVAHLREAHRLWSHAVITEESIYPDRSDVILGMDWLDCEPFTGALDWSRDG